MILADVPTDAAETGQDRGRDAEEEREPMSQQQQYGGHLCPKSPEEVILTLTLRSSSPQVGVTENPILGVNVGPK